ncbi:MAG: nucleotidyltransferase family protein [Nitrososphaerales archaeon]
MKAVVLAGGLGTRLRPYTYFLPKPMLPLGYKPLLGHIIDWLVSLKITNLVICVGYLQKVIEEYFENGADFGAQISYSRSQKPLGTAGQLKHAEPFVDGSFLCVYGDSLYDFELKEVVKLHEKRGALATMVLMDYKTKMKYGFIDLGKDNSVLQWREKPEVSNLINVGCYIMEKEFLKYIPENKMYGMDVAFKNALSEGETICGIRPKGQVIDIGDKESYEKAVEAYDGEFGKIL